MNEIFSHIPVLLTESVTHLITDRDGIYVDATFGRGSHTKAILDQLSPQGRLIAFDKDPEAVAYAKKMFAHEARFQIFHASFAQLQLCLENIVQPQSISGCLFDLGVSSPQLDDPERGFSFMRDGNLDMRMDTTQGIDAKTYLQTVSEADLTQILWDFSEEKFARRIARAIVTQRDIAPIETTAQLATLISNVVPRGAPGKRFKHPATRTFQAIRIAINQELSDLKLGLACALKLLKPAGHLAVISFHSLEDRIVKEFFRATEKNITHPRGLPIKGNDYQPQLKTLAKIKTSAAEAEFNPRARSAILRIGVKQS